MSRRLFDDDELDRRLNALLPELINPFTKGSDYVGIKNFIDSEIRRNLKEVFAEMSMWKWAGKDNWNIMVNEVDNRIARIKRDRGIT